MSVNSRSDMEKVTIISTPNKVDEKVASATSPLLAKSSSANEEEVEKGDGPYTCNDAIESVGFGRFQILLFLIAGFLWMADAMEMMMLSFLGPAVQCKWGKTAQERNLFNSLLTTGVFLGMTFGAFTWGYLADRIGRKKSLASAIIVCLLFGVASAFSPNFWVLLAFRTVVGFGLGGSGVTFSIFLEFLPTKARGTWLLLIEFWWTAGSMVEAAISWGVFPTLGENAWRYMVALSAVPLLIAVCALPAVPESPRFLVNVGKIEKAQKVLERMARMNKKSLPGSHLVGSTISETTSHYPIIEKEMTSAAPAACPRALTFREGVKSLFSTALRKTTLMLWLIWLINAVAYYGLVLLTPFVEQPNSANKTGTDCPADPSQPPFNTSTYVDVFITSGAEFPGLIMSMIIIDRLGRKKTQGIQFAGTGLFVALLLIPGLPIAARVGLLFVARALIMGAFCVTCVYTPEVYPTAVRATGNGVANSIARIGGMVCPFPAYYLVAGGSIAQMAGFGFFAGICIIAAVVAFFLPVETAGKTMADRLASDSVHHKRDDSE
eukprot:CAMPEP_0113912342 /NCGR_PEP_ID=MMETSP0780_2-20120614/28874_1 /TAXON_ID=652834 /ORGANISM="Palpitomonas bilix" /LENGTH=549 /DNA_ID=CAMNT_0000909291 /DNA_START=12 /DNA_END=1661 /DNA_ORIENTATION=- /assembly_acc=CAM_ASM_000599